MQVYTVQACTMSVYPFVYAVFENKSEACNHSELLGFWTSENATFKKLDLVLSSGGAGGHCWVYQKKLTSDQVLLVGDSRKDVQ